MFAKTLSRIIRALPSSIKYESSALKRIYIFIAALGQHVVNVPSIAGEFYWKIDHLTSQEFLLGSYEPYMQNAFVKFINAGFVVYDIGAGAGFHAIFCSLLTGPSGQVIAFEPNPTSYRSLRGQVKVNSRLPIKTFPYALVDFCGQAALDTSKGSLQSRVTESGDIVVEARSIDYLVDKREVPPPKLIKIDIEGLEQQVIMGAAATLKRYKPIILLDYHSEPRVLFIADLLKPFGYVTTGRNPIIAIHDHS